MVLKFNSVETGNLTEGLQCHEKYEANQLANTATVCDASIQKMARLHIMLPKL
jgi:hypothetical protein